VRTEEVEGVNCQFAKRLTALRLLRVNVTGKMMTSQDSRVLSVSNDSTSPRYNEDEVFEQNNNINKPTINHVYVDRYNTQPASDSIATTNVLVHRPRLTLIRSIDDYDDDEFQTSSSRVSSYSILYSMKHC